MTESEFNQRADAVFRHIEQILEASNADIDYDNNSVVMEIEFADSSKLIVNRHAPNQEIWLAAKSGGFHFACINGVWLSQRDNSELYAKLGELILLGSGQKIAF